MSQSQEVRSDLGPSLLFIYPANTLLEPKEMNLVLAPEMPQPSHSDCLLATVPLQAPPQNSMKVLVPHLCPTLCHPTDCGPPGSSVHGILQARTLEWVAISSSRGSSWPRDQAHVSCISCIARGFFATGPLGKPLIILSSCKSSCKKSLKIIADGSKPLCFELFGYKVIGKWNKYSQDWYTLWPMGI